MRWQEHQKYWNECQKCPLGALAQSHVLARWSRATDKETFREWLFVGEAPGPSEDALGEAFVPHAPAGDVLECLRCEAGIESYCITNVIACFPVDFDKLKETGKRDFRAPSKDEAEACNPRVAQLIAIVRPKAIVLLGLEAKRYASKLADAAGIPHCEIAHPSAIGRWDGFTRDWERRRRENVQYKKARDTLALFMETLS